jgi:hypothetical protein
MADLPSGFSLTPTQECIKNVVSLRTENYSIQWLTTGWETGIRFPERANMICFPFYVYSISNESCFCWNKAAGSESKLRLR